MKPTVVIDCFAENGLRYKHGYAVVAIDVIRATTVAVTAAAAGWRCYPVPSLASAFELANTLVEPLLMGEIAGDMPGGFHLNNSPAELIARLDSYRPLVMLSSSGTQLMSAAKGSDATYVACLRNVNAVARYIAARHERIAVVGAGSRGEFREEDQMCCAWIAEILVSHNYEPANSTTRELIDLWSGAPASACVCSRSVDYLKRTDQLQDLDFILGHINDLHTVCALKEQQVVCVEDRTEQPVGPARDLVVEEAKIA